MEPQTGMGALIYPEVLEFLAALEVKVMAERIARTAPELLQLDTGTAAAALRLLGQQTEQAALVLAASLLWSGKNEIRIDFPY
jgi:hypothetical protein